MVLSATPIGEYDRRVVLLTREKGKISAFAKGARRQNSPLIAAVVPLSFGEYTLYEGRTAYSVMQAQISNYFDGVRHDLDKVWYASYFAEIADYFTREYADEVQMLGLLYQSLRALESEKIPQELIRYIYELKALVVNGVYPEVFSCASCGSAEPLQVFDFGRHGMLCSECQALAKDALRISPAALYTMQFIAASDIQKLYTFTVKPEVLQELKKIIGRLVGEQIERPLRSAAFLNGEMPY